MNRKLECDVIGFLEHSQFNYVKKENALRQQYEGMRIFDAPIFAYGSPDDALFLALKKQAIGEHFRMPLEWNPKAKTVVSMFFPFTKEIVESNGENYDYPSEQWIHGRSEGHACLKELGAYIVAYLNDAGYETICPILDSAFLFAYGDKSKPLTFTSNWSDRHVGYICGLGTFGLSKGIITKKGMAGRLLSVITACEYEKTERAYTDIYEYCIKCGSCVSRCPAHAITLKEGKNHELCGAFCDYVRRTSERSDCCGKCQIDVPCTFQIPEKISSSNA